MRHRVKKVKLGREADHRNALLKNLATSIILHEKIKTTKAKAKAVVPKVEKMITLARAVETGKKTKREVIRALEGQLYDENASRKLMEELAVRYKDRNSGFTRMTNLGFRAGDASSMVQIELIP
ncbi:MAG: 50S ribosomal protein L17 [uncultured bacterium]|nr:MAG: 50S ribosomal protein L17 [uncultured bacterium]